jgi:Tol biopolymer transport system component
VLYETLSGKKAFEGESVSDTLAAVMKLEPDWNALPHEVPVSIHKLLRRCLTKDRKQRLRDIGEARIVLADPGGTEVSAQAGSRLHAKMPWVIASILAAGLAAVSFVYVRQPRPAAPQVIQSTIDAPPKTIIRTFAISPNGLYVAMTTTGEGGTELWMRPLDALQPRALAGTEGARSPFWSPDSRDIGFFVGDKLKRISVVGGPVQTICDATGGLGGTWNSEGVIVFGSTVGLMRVSAAGSVPERVSGVDQGSRAAPTFLPDGHRFLYLAAASKDRGLYLGSLDAKPGSPVRRISGDVSNAQYLSPYEGSPHGYMVFVRDQTLMAQPVASNTLQPVGDVFPVIDQVFTPNANGNVYDYSISRNGILLYRAALGAVRQHAVFDRDGKQLSVVGAPVNGPGRVALSVDEKRMASVRGVGRNLDLWITELERGTESRFTYGFRNDLPVWSPDGNYVAFASDRGGNLDLYRKAANQAGPEELLWRSEFLKAPSDWCCEGRFLIFFQISPGTKSDLFALPLNGDKQPIPLLQTEFNEVEGRVSPDGRWLAYASDESGRYDVYVQPFGPASSKPSTGKSQISIGGGRDPRWRRDGREMFYIAPDQKMMAVTVKTDVGRFERGTPKPLFDSRIYRGNNGPLSGYAVSADGKRFLMAPDPETSSESPPLHVMVNWLAGVKR